MFDHESPQPLPSPSTAPTRKANPLMTYLLGVLTSFLVIGGGQLLWPKATPPTVAIQAPPTPIPTATTLPTPLPPPTVTPAPIIIFVSGAVQMPGLYQLPAAARVGDAIHLAGGLAANADGARVNQAEPVVDGAQLHIPTMDETAALQPLVGLSGGASGGAALRSGETGNMIPGGLVEINTASLAQLDTLPGIGPSKAQAIIDQRPYASVDDLARVPGIGSSTIEQLRSLVTVE